MPRVKVKNKVKLGEGTMGFCFEKPAGFQFRAGQFGEWTLINPLKTMRKEARERLRSRRSDSSRWFAITFQLTNVFAVCLDVGEKRS